MTRNFYGIEPLGPCACPWCGEPMDCFPKHWDFIQPCTCGKCGKVSLSRTENGKHRHLKAVAKPLPIAEGGTLT